MSFWLDDDDDGDNINNNNPFRQSSQQSVASSSNKAAASASSKKKNTLLITEAFECENCGGRESYDDNATGMLVCAVCFTQSQTQQTQETQEAATNMDYDEIMAVAAKTATGALLQQRKSNATSGGGKKIQDVPDGLIIPDQCSSALQQVLLRTADGQPVNTGSRKRPIHTLDTSQTLPDAQTCILAMQRVLQQATHILVVDLLELDTDHGSDKKNRGDRSSSSSSSSTTTTTGCLALVDQIVRKIWLSYLNCWAEAVQHYGALYPEVRFSFRDYFLSPMQRASVIQTISYRAFRQVVVSSSSSHKQSTNQHENDTDDSDDDESSIQSDHDDDDDRDHRKPAGMRQRSRGGLNDNNNHEKSNDGMSVHAKTTNHRRKVAKRKEWEMGGSLSRVMQLPRLHRVDKSKGRFEAALMLRPSMTMVATILWLGVARSGVTCHQIVAWIANGTLPLLNAYDCILVAPKTTSMKKKGQSRNSKHRNDNYDDDDDNNSHGSIENTQDVHDNDEFIDPHPLHPIQNFFRMNAPPLACTVEATGTLLLVAAGIKSRDVFAGVSESGPTRGKEGGHGETPAAVALPTPTAASSSTLLARPDRAKDKELPNTGQARKFEGNMIRTLPVACIPVVTAQLVTDLGLTVSQDASHSTTENDDEFDNDEMIMKNRESVPSTRGNKNKNSNDNGGGQAVLNVALALMGVIKGGPQDGLTRSLPGATPLERVSSLAHVLAILLCSCVILEPAQRVVASSNEIRELEESQQQQEWWRFIRQGGPAATVAPNDADSSCDDENEGQSDDSDNERRRRLQKRWVPWTEDQSRLLGNGPSLEGYLDFLEESLLGAAKKNSLTVAGGLENSFLDDLQDVPSSSIEVGQKRVSTSMAYPRHAVRPYAQIAPGGIMSLIRPAGTTSEAGRLQSVSLLRQRILHALYQVKRRTRCDRIRRISKQKVTGDSIVLNPTETLRLEFLAHSTQTPTIQIRMALEEVLL